MRLTLILCCLISATAFGQNATKTSFVFERKATVNMNEPSEDWNIGLQHLETPKPGIAGPREELMIKKREIMKRFPRTETSSIRSGSSTLSVGNNFEGNGFQGVPNDNDMAISRNGTVVSVTNSQMYVFDGATGDQLARKSLGAIQQPLNLNGNKYDPKVVYDPNNDRFVIVFLNGTTWQTSYIVVGFSKTNDPTGDWNLYALHGNPLENETWSDYPVIGISGKDLFIGINTFTNGSTNNSGFTETCLWQVGLKEGYIGFDLSTNYFSNILPQNRAIFNICPVSPAAESDSENMYLLSNRNTDLQNDTVFLLEVTGRVTNPNTQLNVTVVHTDQPYILPVPADQPSSEWFDTNDSRILGGYILNGRIYFVQSCTDPINGRAGIYHGVIDDVAGNPTMVSRIYSEPDIDYGYPNISWTGQSINDEQSIINFNHSGNDDFAGFSAIHIDESLIASNRITIKEGLASVNVMQDTLERWGDYSGSQRMYNQPGIVWAVGSFGNQSGGHATWIAELASPNASTGVETMTSSDNQASIYPNPFSESVSVDFNLEDATFLRLELVDATGKLIRLLLEDRVKAGKNQISFSESHLPAGSYFLLGKGQGKTLFSKTVIKQ